MLKPIRINCGVYSVSIIIILHQLMMEGSPVQCSPSALLGDEFRLYFTRDLRLPDYFPLSTTTAKETRHPVSGAVGCQYTPGMWRGDVIWMCLELNPESVPEAIKKSYIY